MIETNLAQTINATNDSGSVYDTNVKYLLADKQILSRILKEKQFLGIREIHIIRI